MTTFKNNIILRAHLEHSELWQFEDGQMGAGELARPTQFAVAARRDASPRIHILPRN